MKTKTKRKYRTIDKKNENEITLKMELDFEKELMNILNGGELSF